jgi:DNA-damage-inducible protein J
MRKNKEKKMINNANLSLRIDDTTKKEAARIVEGLGFDLPTSIRMYLRQIVIQKGIPFPLTFQNEIPNEETVEAMREGSKIIASGRKRFSDTKDFFKSLEI